MRGEERREERMKRGAGRGFLKMKKKMTGEERLQEEGGRDKEIRQGKRKRGEGVRGGERDGV